MPMRAPRHAQSPELGMGARIGLAVFALALIVSAVLSGLNAADGIGLSSRGISGSLDLADLAVFSLFAPMTVVLLAGAWSLLVCVAMGRKEANIHRGALWVLAVVLTLAFAGIAVCGLLDGEWAALAAVAEGLGGLYVISTFLRGQPPAPPAAP
jgi:heme/copper-type cytochrome/quinol oxidase subunit 3